MKKLFKKHIILKPLLIVTWIVILAVTLFLVFSSKETIKDRLLVPNIVTLLDTEPIQIENPDFRNVKWWMTMDEVIVQEWEPHIRSENVLQYKILISWENYVLIYGFYEWKLISSNILLDETYNNELKYIEAFDELSNLYKTKYWESEIRKRIDSPYKDTRDDWWMALYMWKLVFMYSWETETSSILMYVMNSNISRLGVYHTSKELYPAYEEYLKQQELLNI